MIKGGFRAYKGQKIERSSLFMYPAIKLDPLPGVNCRDRGRVNTGKKTRAELSLHREGFNSDTPVIVRIGNDGRAAIRDGNHRVRAAIKVGIVEVPVIAEYESVEAELADGEFRMGGSYASR